MANNILKQWYFGKSIEPENIVLLRCGDFYETYLTDASVCAEVLGITLTSRYKENKKERYYMAGFPYHALDTYLPRLIRAGYNVSILDGSDSTRELDRLKSLVETHERINQKLNAELAAALRKIDEIKELLK